MDLQFGATETGYHLIVELYDRVSWSYTNFILGVVHCGKLLPVQMCYGIATRLTLAGHFCFLCLQAVKHMRTAHYWCLVQVHGCLWDLRRQFVLITGFGALFLEIHYCTCILIIFMLMCKGWYDCHQNKNCQLRNSGPGYQGQKHPKHLSLWKTAISLCLYISARSTTWALQFMIYVLTSNGCSTGNDVISVIVQC